MYIARSKSANNGTATFTLGSSRLNQLAILSAQDQSQQEHQTQLQPTIEEMSDVDSAPSSLPAPVDQDGSTVQIVDVTERPSPPKNTTSTMAAPSAAMSQPHVQQQLTATVPNTTLPSSSHSNGIVAPSTSSPKQKSNSKPKSNALAADKVIRQPRTVPDTVTSLRSLLPVFRAYVFDPFDFKQNSQRTNKWSFGCKPKLLESLKDVFGDPRFKGQRRFGVYLTCHRRKDVQKRHTWPFTMDTIKLNGETMSYERVCGAKFSIFK